MLVPAAITASPRKPSRSERAGRRRRPPACWLATIAATVAWGLASSGAPVQAADAVSPRQLSVMVLPPNELGGLVSGLELDEDSGVYANEDAANDGPRACRTPAALGRLGRVTGYALSYEDFDLSRVKEGAGVTEVESRVDLYRDPAGASRALRRHLADKRRQVGLTLAGATFQGLDTFDVRTGDEALGLREHIRIGSYRPESATVVVRVGRLLGRIELDWIGGRGYERNAAELSRLLSARIAAVLAGRVRDDPVSIPSDRVPPPRTGPDLSAMALRVSDLGPGAWATRGEYVRTGAVASYERDLDPGCGGPPTFIQSTVTLNSDVGEAKRAFASESADLGQAASLLQQGPGRAIGLFAPARGEALPVGKAGDERRAVRVLARGLAKADFAFAIVRVDRAVGVLVLGRVGGKFTDREAAELLGHLARRMQDGLPTADRAGA